MSNKITSFEQLISWQKAITFATNTYKITKNFPRVEQYALSSQLQRAAVSVSANIAEGFGRANKNEKLQFYSIAYGSLLESKSHLYIAAKLGYLDKITLDGMIDQATKIQQLINASKSAIKKYEK